MAYILTFNNDYTSEDFHPLLNGALAVSGTELKNGDVITFYTGAYKASGFRFDRISATIGEQSYSYLSGTTVETIERQNINILFTKMTNGSSSIGPISHIINFVAAERSMQIIYDGNVIATVPESDFGSAHKRLTCNGKIMESDVDIEFTEV